MRSQTMSQSNEIPTSQLMRNKYESVHRMNSVSGVTNSSQNGISTSQPEGILTNRSKHSSAAHGTDSGRGNDLPHLEDTYSVADVYSIGLNASRSLREFVGGFSALAQKSNGANETAVKRRKAGFASCDLKGTGRIRLIEIESFVWSNLKNQYGMQRGDELYDAFAPCIAQAYEAAKEVKRVMYLTAGSGGPGQDDDGNGDFITFQFFRVFNIYLCVYAGMLDAFRRIIGGNSGISGNTMGADIVVESLMTREQWLNQYMYVGASGFVFPPTIDAAETAFNVMCFISSTDEQASVQFSAFCTWINGFEIKSYSPLGEFLNGTADAITEARSVKSMNSKLTASTITASSLSQRTVDRDRPQSKGSAGTTRSNPPSITSANRSNSTTGANSNLTSKRNNSTSNNSTNRKSPSIGSSQTSRKSSSILSSQTSRKSPSIGSSQTSSTIPKKATVIAPAKKATVIAPAKKATVVAPTTTQKKKRPSLSTRGEHVISNVITEKKRQEQRLSNLRASTSIIGDITEKKRQEQRLSNLRASTSIIDERKKLAPEEKKDDLHASTSSSGLQSILRDSSSRRFASRRRSSVHPERNNTMQRQSSITLLNMMRQSFVIPKMTKSSKIATQDALRELSQNARIALQDFSEHLKVLNKEALDEDMFMTLLDDMGYTRDRTGLFNDLLDDISEVNPGTRHKTDISVDDMLALYISEPYHLLDNGKDTGAALMEYIDKIFDDVDLDGNGGIDHSEAGLLVEKLIAREPSKDEVDALFTVLDTDNSGMIDRIEFKHWVLKPNANNDIGIPRSFNHTSLDPALVTPAQFVQELEGYTLNHRAIKHHFLQNLASAAFGKEETADLLLRFFAAYSHFNKGFVGNVQKLHDLLPNQRHKDILKANLAEENGYYDEETLIELEDLGIERACVENIPHPELYRAMVDTLEKMHKRSYRAFVPENIVAIKRKAIEELVADGKSGLLAAVYFGSELIVPELYTRLLQGLQHSCGISNRDARFLILHIDMDHDHAEQLRGIVIDNCATKEDRIKIVKNTEKILNARVKFYDALRAQSDFQESSSSTSSFYDEQVDKWIRFHPKNLGDFTCRPTVFEMCEDLLQGSTVLDVGCGEGYVSRNLKAMGAQKIVGVDISKGMIEAAKRHWARSSDEYYIIADARTLKKNLVEKSAQTNMMLGAQFDIGFFDLSVAVCLFNNMTISEMNSSFEQIYSVLKPGGHFIFSVPHPAFLSHHDTEIVSYGKEIKRGGYFSLRDKQFDGRMKMIDGDELMCRVYFKAFEDYISAIKSNGFDLIEAEETRVTPEHLNGEDSAFFNAVNDCPLHLVMKCRKPLNVSQSAAVGTATTIDLLPKKLTWNKTMINHFANVAVVMLPEPASLEICNAAYQCYKRGLSVDDIVIGQHVDPRAFKTTKQFCTTIRSKLLHQTGAVIIKGLDMEKLGGEKDMEKMTACSKIAYFLICEHIGTVDGGARGNLFDVVDEHIDANDSKVDNVLFSVSSAEAGWHTDGASKDRVYDVVGLLCISPAAEGGKFRFSNACNVYDDMTKAMPKFMMYEMIRPLPRDVLENGNGLGEDDISSTMSRSNDILAMRIRYNSYPIYVTEGDRMRFRYMRHWINTGHSKTGWKVPTLLRISMDLLDDGLDNGCVFHKALERGDMIFANNAMLAHARDSFKNKAGHPPRHKVRAWLQVQKRDILNSHDEEELEAALTKNLLRGQNM